MGSGDIGSNGSVHWKVTYDDNAISADHMDYDEMDHKTIGLDKGHPGKFRLTARFQSIEDAEQALGDIAKRFKNTPSKEIYLDVNVRPERPKPGPSHEWEIRIDW
jgi:hypothetical protein